MGKEPVSLKGTASETSPLPPGCQGEEAHVTMEGSRQA